MMSFLLALIVLQPAEETLSARRDRAASRVEEIRGSKFSSPVEVVEGSRKECATAAVDAAKQLYGDDLAGCERALKALGLVGGRVRLDLAISAYAMQGAQAYACKGAVALINTKLGEDELAFRLTMALADQRHASAEAAKSIGPLFDSQMALAAVRQGDADMTKQLLWASKKIDEKHGDGHLESLVAGADKWERETSKFASMAVPRIFVRAADFPYRRGGIFMETIRARGGMAAVDNVYARLPRSTEQVLHPEKYLADERPATIDPKSAHDFLVAKGYRRVWSSVLGELGASIIVETHIKDDTSKVGPGWGGDLLLYYELGERKPLVVWATSWDTETDAIEFQAAAFKIVPALAADAGATNLALRKGTSVALILNLTRDLQDAALDAIWKCEMRTGDAAGPYGSD